MKKKSSEFYRLAQKALKGLQSIGASLGLAHVTAVLFGPVLTGAKGKANEFNLARAAKAGAYDALRDRREEADEGLVKTRNYLSAFLGAGWSPAWVPLGFATPSLELPAKDDDRLTVLQGFEDHFTAHPERENADEDFTAEHMGNLRTALDGAMTLVDNCREDTRTKRDQRDAAEKKLDEKLNCLYSELESVLTPLDPRWLKFIDRIPGDPRVPEQVEEVTATAAPGGHFDLNWPDAARAARYKVFKQIVGVDAEPVLADTVDESEAALDLPNVSAGTTVKLQIVPINEVGEGAPSEVIVLQAA